MRNLAVVLAMITTWMVSAQEMSKERQEHRTDTPVTEYSFAYQESNWNECQLREAVIGQCRRYLLKNGRSILSPGYQEIAMVFRECNMTSFLLGDCPRVQIESGDHIDMAWRVDKGDGVYDMVLLIIKKGSVIFSIEEYRD